MFQSLPFSFGTRASSLEARVLRVHASEVRVQSPDFEDSGGSVSVSNLTISAKLTRSFRQEARTIKFRAWTSEIFSREPVLRTALSKLGRRYLTPQTRTLVFASRYSKRSPVRMCSGGTSDAPRSDSGRINSRVCCYLSAEGGVAGRFLRAKRWLRASSLSSKPAPLPARRAD
jgi:hypothetical protein